MFRQPIITIMGHIDSGKTTFLDKIKGTSIAKQEAGKITQHIGATEITLDIIKDKCAHLFEKFKFDVDIPGLLFIDTPGHNAFDNLRERGGSLADLVVLVVDINKGLQAQDFETLEILKLYKVPFIVFANKVDLLKGWYQEGNDISNNLTLQSKDVLEKLDEQLYKIVGDLYTKGFQSERFDRVTDFKKQIAIIPGSAERGWGLSEGILFLSTLSQKFLGSKITLKKDDPAKATILEVSELKGIGSTMDCIVYQGVLNLKDEIAFITKKGVFTTKVKALLKPNVMVATNKKEKYKRINYVVAASGIKIVAPGIEDAIPGSAVVSIKDIEAYENLKAKPLSCLTQNKEIGAYVKADTLGSLEALLKLLEKNNICVSKADIGDVTRKDLLELKILNQKDSKKGVLFLFNSNIKKEFLEDLKSIKIPIFKNNIIYKLIEDYQDWLKKQIKLEQDALEKEIVFPAKIKVLKNHVFRTSKPAIVGIKVLEGKLVSGVKLLKNEKEIGILNGIQSEGKYIKQLEKDKEAAISIKNATYLKDFKEEDTFEVYIPKDSLKKLNDLDYDFNNEEIELIKNAKKRLEV